MEIKIMDFNFSWLPELFKYDNRKSIEEYYNEVYEIFKRDFITSKPVLFGKNIGLQKEPMVNGKPQTFHHMTTEDICNNKNKQSKLRNIAFDRCERIAWNRAIIDSGYVGLKIFRETRSRNRKNLIIFFEEKDFVIVLREAPTYYVFITSYPIKYKNKKRQLQKSYEKYIKAETASKKADSTLFLH